MELRKKKIQEKAERGLFKASGIRPLCCVSAGGAGAKLVQSECSGAPASVISNTFSAENILLLILMHKYCLFAEFNKLERQ